ncbi:ATP-grasp domain-containing protein [Pedobacter sp. KLB.chiD]|uniref:ATP-grasp domain-containing protein n=1 Tax=Pedobacter sp. KLB.chiD TaxID=3387402 RepID=UPI00399B52A5
MKKIALITYLDQGAYDSITVESEDDKLLNFLKEKGLNIEKVIWNDTYINWEEYSIAILKSPWDYFDLIEDFYTWLDLLETKKVKLLNPIDVVRWNSDKRYLKEIETAGLKIIPSIFINKQDRLTLKHYFEKFNTNRLIVKPCISGGAKNTFRVTINDVDALAPKLNQLLQEEDFIIQPFLPEILESGEWSFIFFNGTYSHSLIKKAKAGDFRVQPAHGGSVHPQNPDHELIATAQQYIDLFAKNCLYARVDGTFANGEFLLMELELIEPFLFLNTATESYDRYYKALKELI